MLYINSIIEYIITVIILNELLFVCSQVKSSKNKKSRSFYFTFTYFFSRTFPFFM